MKSVSLKHKQDGGWAMVILLATFYLNFTLGISSVIFSVIYMDLCETFQETKGMIGLVVSTLMLSECCGLFIGGLFITVFGVRPVAIIGTLVCVLGHLGCAFSTNLAMLHLTFGFLAGGSRGMSRLCYQVIIQQWFDKKRSFAAGIALMGISLGNLVAPLLVRACMEEYTWRGAEIILAAIFLQGLVCVCLFRTSPAVKVSIESYKSKNKATESSNKYSLPPASTETEQDDKSLQFLELNESPKLVPDISVPNRSNVLVSNNLEPNNEKIKAIPKNQRMKLKLKISYLCKKMWDFSILKNKLFLLMLIGISAKAFGILTMYAHISSMAVTIGIAKSDALLMPTFASIGNVTIRFIVSFLTDFPQCNRLLLFAIFLSLTGLWTCVVPLVTTYSFAVAFAMVFGTLCGVEITIQDTVLRDLFGISQISKTVSIAGIFYNIFGAVAVPMTGWLYDVLHSYSIPFVIIGTIHATGSIGVWIVFFYERRNKAKLTKEAQDLKLNQELLVEKGQ